MTTQKFLPDSYEAPSGSSDFMKLEEGTTRFRIMSPAVIGWEGWKDNKPFRREGIAQNIDNDEVDTDSKYGKPKPKISHFWAFKVYDYADKQVKIFSVTQKTIMKAVEGLYKDEDWGDPSKYDIAIEKTKSGDKTSYSIKSYPHKALTKDMEEALASSDIDLSSLFEDGKGFGAFDAKKGKKK